MVAREKGAGLRPRVSGVGVLDRSVSILSAVEAGARSFTGIVGATGLTRSTAHRLIGALEDQGFLLHVGGLGYALGSRLLALASAAARDLPLRQLAHPPLERLARTTGESAQLYVREGERRICIDVAESERELRTIVEIGASLPLDKGSAGKVFLAWGTERDGERLARDRGRLAQQVATTRRRGWADSVAEREPGVASVSAPVFGPGGALLAAVSVSGPATRLGPLRAKRYAPAVVETAREIERALGT
ncbi:MAG TPA: IclR family transcriptional regulator [Actinomycetota bacterium]|nr:IclR family transcriptional regulator [Actinomycetota bacterium]